MMVTWLRLGVAHAISPDARFRHPAFRSLDGNRPSPGTDPPEADWSWLRLVSNAGSIGMGHPSRSIVDHEHDA